MIRLPSYLLLSSYGVYYFRIMVPKGLISQFKGRREIRRSLGTSSRKLAIQKARELRIEADLIFQRAEKMPPIDAVDYGKLHHSFDYRKSLVQREGEYCLELLKRAVDAQGPIAEDSLEFMQNPLGLLQERYGLTPEGARVALFYGHCEMREDLLTSEVHDEFRDQLRRVYEDWLIPQLLEYSRSRRGFSVPSPGMVSIRQHVTLPSPIEVTSSALISQVVEEFCAEKKRVGSWREKTENENRAIYDMLIGIIGDVPVGSIDHALARTYKQALQKIPPNLNKLPRYRGMKILEVVESNPEEVMSVTTVNKNINRIATLFDWAEKNGHVAKNYFSGLGLKVTKQAHEERSNLDNDDLLRLFSTKIFTAKVYKHSYYYWLPLIALYTGARINEICQLGLADIREEDGVWVFDINDSGEGKRVKTASGKRLIPIHSKLIELGILDRVRKLKDRGESRLFPELKKQRDGYAQTASKWFNDRYRKSCGVTGEGKCFHSFRHTVANHLKQKGVEPVKIAAIIGHKDESMTTGRYGDPYRPTALKEIIEMLDFDLGA